MTHGRFVLLVTMIIGSLQAQAPDAKIAIKSIYASTLAGMRAAQTKDDVANVVNGIDVPEWTSSLFNGQTMTRSQGLRELEGLLSIPSEKRPGFQMSIVYWNETAAHVRVVYWVYREQGNELVGSLARDTWARTASGWRRLRHEKFLPDQPLVVDGKGVIVPPGVETIRTP
jgi:hypothetical protein